jgi:eukaryotic-like serine/threonine-protein kinase
VQVARKEDVLKALDQATTKLRTSLGESLSMVQQYDTPIAEATTSSLEALKAYSLGMKAARAAEAIPFFKRAVELDPNFALAYVGLGVSHSPNLLEPGLAAENIRKAYQLRDRVSEREKLNITAVYYGGVTGELEKAIQVTELWARTYPRDPAAHTGLGCLGRLVGKPDPAKVTFGEVLNHYLAYGKKKTGEDKATPARTRTSATHGFT